jgi:predicted dehydrogenase
MEAFMYRFHPRTEHLIERVRSGAIGEIRALHATFSFRLARTDNIRLDPALGGGALMDVGCYCVNVSRTLAGEEPVEVSAWARMTERGVDDQMAGMMRFPSGLIAQFDCALTIERRERYEVAGTEGAFVVPSAFLPGAAAAVYRELRGRAGETTHVVEGADQYRLMVEHFSDCVLHDRPVRYPPEEAALNMRLIEALYRSARAGGRPEPVSAG